MAVTSNILESIPLIIYSKEPGKVLADIEVKIDGVIRDNSCKTVVCKIERQKSWTLKNGA